MKLTAMTLGCPEWDLETIINRAAVYGFDGIDFRGIQCDLDVSSLPAFTTDAARTARRIADHGLETSGISSSIHLCSADKGAAALDEARRTLEAAINVGAKHVRVFGEGDVETIGLIEAAKIGRDCVEVILRIPGADQVSWNFETHDHWVRGADCKLLLDAVPNPAFGAAWDLAHTKQVGGESAEQTYAVLKDRLRYVQIKDAVRDPTHPNAMKSGWRYVLPGDGELQLADGLDVLFRNGYDGWLMFEHEKRWHPELEPPEIAFPAYVRWARGVLKSVAASATGNS